MALQASMSALQAEDELRAGVSDDRLYDVAIEAGLTPDEAGDLLSARISARLKRNEEVSI